MKLQWLAPRSSIPEMELGDFCRLMKDCYGILHEPVVRRPNWFRFIGSPYNAYAEECRSISMMAHNRGTRFSPHHIKQVLAKFRIDEEHFKDCYNQFFGLSPTSASPPPTGPRQHDSKAADHAALIDEPPTRSKPRNGEKPN